MKILANENAKLVIMVILCFLLVIGTAELFVYFRNTFERNHKVSAEILPTLPAEIKKNQIRYLIEEGYLTDAMSEGVAR